MNTITISDFNAGSYVFTNTTSGVTDIMYTITN